MPKSSKTEYDLRILEVMDLLTKGYKRPIIVSLIIDFYEVGEAQVKKDIKTAIKRLASMVEEQDKEEHIKDAIISYNSIYERAIAAKQLQVALNAKKELYRILGIETIETHKHIHEYEDIKDMTDDEIRQEIAAIAAESNTTK